MDVNALRKAGWSIREILEALTGTKGKLGALQSPIEIPALMARPPRMKPVPQPELLESTTDFGRTGRSGGRVLESSTPPFGAGATVRPEGIAEALGGTGGNLSVVPPSVTGPKLPWASLVGPETAILGGGIGGIAGLSMLQGSSDATPGTASMLGSGGVDYPQEFVEPSCATPELLTPSELTICQLQNKFTGADRADVRTSDLVPYDVNFPKAPDLGSRLAELQKAAPGREGAVSPDDKWRFILSGLADAAMGLDSRTNIHDAILKLGAGMLRGRLGLDSALRTQERTFAEDEREFARQMASLGINSDVAQFNMGKSLADMALDVAKAKNATSIAASRTDGTSLLNEMRRERVLGGLSGPLDYEAIYGQLPPEEVSSLLNPEDERSQGLRDEITRLSTISGLSSSASSKQVAAAIVNAWCQTNPTNCRELIAKSRLSGIK